ncbi:HEAT repeat domain-containing protein [Streptomyces sp. NPDC050508]|uniref:HEAT repeat domain-containing protein n=1 Tax=Streptomyces sp. NPDC050508 TaxID=3155405 RepID=UPI00341C3198
MTSGLEAALAGASSSSWSQRVRAGRDLASFADVPEAAEALVRLLLDVEDSAVTRRTAEALARVGTAAVTRLIALAGAEADDSQADWIQTGVHDALAGADVGRSAQGTDTTRQPTGVDQEQPLPASARTGGAAGVREQPGPVRRCS